MTGGEPIPVTSGDAADTNPSWSRDGNQIAFLSVRSDMPRIWVVDPEVRSAAEVKDSVAETQGELGMDWLADGRLLWTVPGSENYVIRDLQSGKEELLLSQPKDPHRVAWMAGGFARLAERQAARGLVEPSRATPRMGCGSSTGLRETRACSFRAITILLDGPPTGSSSSGIEYLGRDVVRVSTATGKAQPIGAFPQGALEGCDVSPDAKIVICAVRETKSDAWLVENFDPKLPVSSSVNKHPARCC